MLASKKPKVPVRTDYHRSHVSAMESTAEQESARMLAKPRVAFGLLKSALSASLNDNVQRMSAALAYYTIFSLAPLLVSAIAIAGLVFGEDAARGEIVGEIRELVGQDGAKAIQTMIQSAYHPGPSA